MKKKDTCKKRLTETKDLYRALGLSQLAMPPYNHDEQLAKFNVCTLYTDNTPCTASSHSVLPDRR